MTFAARRLHYDGWVLFVPQRLDRIEARGTNRRDHSEENADRGREAEAKRE